MLCRPLLNLILIQAGWGKLNSKECLAKITMSNPKIPRFDPTLPRTIISTMIWLVSGFMILNAISSRRVLECDRQAGHIQCQLTSKQLLFATKVPEFEQAKLQKAVLDQRRGSRRIKGYQTIDEINLVTTTGKFRLTTNDRLPSTEQYQIIAKINTFLENSQARQLKVEDGYSTIFWIGTGIFSVISAMCSFAIFFTLRFPIPNASQASSEPNQSSWGGKLENIDQESEHHRIIKQRSID
jgi:hypothetical protein